MPVSCIAACGARSCGARRVPGFELPPLEFDDVINCEDTYPMPTVESDPYDPRKPEYMQPASPEEVDNTNMILLVQQIQKLETIIAKSKEQMDFSGESGNMQVIQHYEHILNEMRSSASLAYNNARRQSAKTLVDIDEWHGYNRARRQSAKTLDIDEWQRDAKNGARKQSAPALDIDEWHAHMTPRRQSTQALDVDEWKANQNLKAQWQDMHAFEAQFQAFEAQWRKTKAEIEHAGAANEELGLMDENVVECESPQIRPSIMAGPGEMLRHYTVVGKDLVNDPDANDMRNRVVTFVSLFL